MRTHVVLGWLVAVAMALTAPLWADEATAATRLTEAVAAAPAVTAARLRLEAALARQSTAGRRADASLTGMYAEKQTPAADIPMWEVSLEQPLPKWGERAADQRGSDARAAMARAELSLVAGDTAAESAMRLAEAGTARERQALIVQQEEHLARALSALDARIGTGQSRAAERLILQSRLADMQLMVAREEQMALDAESLVRAQLGLDGSASLPAFDAPPLDELDVECAPAVRVAEARVQEASAMEDMARASRMPMTAVGLRFEREDMPDGAEDTVGLALMTELPWRRQGYARADGAAARAERDAGLADAEAARHQMEALRGQAQRAEQQADLARRLAADHDARLDAQYEVMLRTAGTAEMDAEMPVLMLVDILEQRTRVWMQVVEAEGSERFARAALWRLVSEDSYVSEGE